MKSLPNRIAFEIAYAVMSKQTAKRGSLFFRLDAQLRLRHPAALGILGQRNAALALPGIGSHQNPSPVLAGLSRHSS